MNLQNKPIVVNQSAVSKVGGREIYKEAERVRKGKEVKSTLLTVLKEASRIVIL